MAIILVYVSVVITRICSYQHNLIIGIFPPFPSTLGMRSGGLTVSNGELATVGGCLPLAEDSSGDF